MHLVTQLHHDIAPDRLRNLSVSEYINFMTWDLPTSPEPQKNTQYGSIGLPSFNAMIAFLHQLRASLLSINIVSVVAYIACLLVALSNRTCKLAVVFDVIRLILSLKSSWDTSVRATNKIMPGYQLSDSSYMYR